MTLAGLEHSRPAPAGRRASLCSLGGEKQGSDGRPQATPSPSPLSTERTLGHREWGRTRIGSPPCTRLLADHKRKGKWTYEAGMGAVTGSYLRAPAGPGTVRKGRFPFTTRLVPVGLGLRLIL